MELFKRKHSTQWITLLIVFSLNNYGYGYQGIPSWISLGIKSPFVEFTSEFEVLANNSIAVNLTGNHHEATELHRKGLQTLGTFINPIVAKSNKTDTVQVRVHSKHTETILLTESTGTSSNKNIDDIFLQSNKVELTEKPLMNQFYGKEITIIEEPILPDETTPADDRKDRKYIIPLALKNPADEPKKNPIFQDSSTNIEDLKRHIIMLQNLTKNDRNFQSKFVVFPNLQQTTTSTTTYRPFTPQPYSSITNVPRNRNLLNVPKQTLIRQESILRDPLEDDRRHGYPMEKITIVPQVLLQNDQTPIIDETPTRNRENKKEIRVSYSGKYGSRKNNRKSTTTIRTTTTTTTTTTTSLPPVSTTKSAIMSRRLLRRQQKQNLRKNKNLFRQTQCKDELNIKKCRSVNTEREKIRATTLPTEVFVNRSTLDTLASSTIESSSEFVVDKTLSRSARSHKNVHRSARHQTTTIGSVPSMASYYNSGNYRDIMIPMSGNNYTGYNRNQTIHLNPNLCYKARFLTYQQQKLCANNTELMPAISRGARAAIQECKHQFKNRRWNCDTVDDDTVFGPITSIGSPEMAFVHALAAAGAASFIARACRDGQLTSCGCSRSARPKQLQEDWTWGGCGDDLQFSYNFAQNFIDSTDEEIRRGTRGLVSLPPKNTKFVKFMQEQLNETNQENDDNKDGESVLKQEDFLELQQKIAKEILSSKLEEEEMYKLQAKINRELVNSKVFNLENHGLYSGGNVRKKGHRKPGKTFNRSKHSASQKARSLMNIHNNEAGRRAVIKNSKITCKCHGVSGSCSLITCWQQLTSMREVGDYLREKYDEATQVKINKRGRLQVKDRRYTVPSDLDLVYLDGSPDWCRPNKDLQWAGTRGRVCNKTSSGLDGCAILCCGRGYNTKKISVPERCNCKFHWCCQVKCSICVKNIEEHTCK